MLSPKLLEQNWDGVSPTAACEGLLDWYASGAPVGYLILRCGKGSKVNSVTLFIHPHVHMRSNRAEAFLVFQTQTKQESCPVSGTKATILSEVMQMTAQLRMNWQNGCIRTCISLTFAWRTEMKLPRTLTQRVLHSTLTDTHTMHAALGSH